MKKQYIILACSMLVVLICAFTLNHNKEEKDKEVKTLNAVVLSQKDNILTIEDDNNNIYNFEFKNATNLVGNKLFIEYSGLLDKNASIQDVSLINWKTIGVIENNDNLPESWIDNGIFSKYYKVSYEKLKTMTLDEKIGQLLLVRYQDDKAIDAINKYHVSGFVFYEKDFANKDETQVKQMIKNVQTNSQIPLLTAVDEEGGKIVRISSNPKLINEKFKASYDLYEEGGFDLIKKDTIEKSRILSNLGINLNLAPVVDVSIDANDYIYERTIRKDTNITSEYASTVIKASKNTNVSYTLKHFPGYGNNKDTHTGVSVDDKTLDDIKTYDLPPFKSGIDAQAEAVLFSHNTVNAIDRDNPTSLSLSAHNILKNDLGFTGITITDDISMQALDSISNKTVKSLLAGNDLVITTNYEESFNEIKSAINNGTLSEVVVNKLAFRVLSWKYYKGLINDNAK